MMRAATSEVLDFKKTLVAAMMKLQERYAGLELRVEVVADYDGYRVGMKKAGEEPVWMTVSYLPGPLGLPEIQGIVDQVVALMGAREDRGRSLLPGRTL